jgi:hypothetical protein
MAVTHLDARPRPRWPARSSLDLASAYVSYDPPADELIVYFGGKPVPKYVSPIDSPGDDFAAVMVGVHGDESSTGEVVGVHVMPLLVGAVQTHPTWAVLAWASLTGFRWEEAMMRQAVAAFVAEVADLFDRYWTPAPPWEEQVANLRRAKPENGAGDESR